MKKLLLTALVSFCIGSLAMAQQAKMKTTTKATATVPVAKAKVINEMAKSKKALTEKEVILLKQKAAGSAKKTKAASAKQETVVSVNKPD